MPTIDSVIARSAAAAPDRIAIREWGGAQITYAAFDTAVSAFAAWSRDHGVAEGDAIAIHLPNSIGYLVAQFGSFRAGAVATYVNYRLSETEAQRQFRFCNARLIVTTPEKAAHFRRDPALASVTFLVDGEDGAYEHTLRQVIAAGMRPAFGTDGLEDRDAIIRFTSGSTGEPKGLIVTHRAWLVRAVSMLAEEMRIRPESTTLVLGQLSHQAGLFVIPTFLQRATLLVMRKFDLETVAAIFAAGNLSCAQVVPTMFTLILNDPQARHAFAQSGLERIVYGGSPIRQSVLEDAMSLLPATQFVQSYGSHEAGSISFLDGAGHRDPVLRHSAGRPMLAAEVRLRNRNAEGVGEIEVKAPWLPNARLTANGREPIDEEWAATGDLGEMIDGHIFLRDRMNDVIISGGFNVYPVEVEKIIGSHPHVLDAAVASAPDDKWGERVIAFVVSRNPGEFSEESVREHCKSLLAGYKVPKEFHLIPEMPLNPNGKPDRRRLSEPLWAGRSRRIN
ncbi:MAG: class I adenylate-forming enzyme family protein [Burkholderiales bacterium]